MKHRRYYFDVERSRSWRATGLRFIGLALATATLLLTAPFINPPIVDSPIDPPLESPQKDYVSQPPAPLTPAEPPRVAVKLRRGETLTAVLTRFGLKPPSAYALVEKVKPFLNPREMRPGHDMEMVLSPEDKSVQGVEMVVDNNVVRVKATADGWLAEREEIPFVRETRVIRGTISDSLYQSGIDAGLTAGHIMALAKIFEYDIDFFSDFHPGDAFSFAVEELRYADGRQAFGRILAAELESGDDTFSTFYYVGKNGRGGYYDSEGRSARRAFLRAPLSYSRISSPFNRKRRHPIFRTVRPHLAIDYAAPAGTPVVAIGKGHVAFVGWRRGYGKVVDIRHSGEYLSRYAHFSRFPRGLRKGRAVEAGDVVGYVGQTGHATGPHLHFEFLRDGRKINFLSLRIPKKERLTAEDLKGFRLLRDARQALLRQEKTRIAQNADGS
ncbi:MAG: peptidoglycan DD-metalloendopeptidase family protein [Candidatus Binatia bacterium]